MRKYFILIIPLLLTLSCTKEKNYLNNASLDSDDYIETFVNVLSKAVYSESDLRSFIKIEALSQFDKDYDVFYPYAKDKSLANGMTFRECLLKYFDNEQLTELENNLPLLNILVPDWSWMDAFDLHKWDVTTNDILVGFVNNRGEHVIYENGNKLGVIDDRAFFESPIIIVKENERMVVKNSSTKANSELEYEFANEAFDPKLTKGVAVETSFIHPATNPGSNIVEAESFRQKCPEAVESWKEYGTDPQEAQRKYAYYSMRKNDSLGVINPQIRESILAIRLNNKNCIDDSNDPSLHSTTKEKSDYASVDDIINDIWSDGQFEILLRATVTDSKGVTTILNDNANVIPVDGKDLFDIQTIKREFRHKTLFSPRKYKYIANVDDLEPKWYYLPTPLAFKYWDPAESSSIVNIHAYEVDPSSEISVTDTVITQKGISISATATKWFQISFKSNAKIEKKTMSYTIKKDSDDLGKKEFRFGDSIITDENDNGYELAYYSTGSLDFIIAPQSKVK